MSSVYPENDPHYSTKAIHVGQEPEQWNSLAVVPLISMATTFKQYEPGQPEKYEYGRGGNPTRNVLEACMASLDNAKHCLTFSSGLACMSAITDTLKSGDHIVSMNDIYGGSDRFFRRIASSHGLSTTFIDLRDYEKFASAIQDNTRLIWVETPTNPNLNVVDIKRIVDIVKGKDPEIVVAVDNTFETSYFQRPLEHGADISYYSCTKYMNGHSDVVMGAICLNNEKLHEKLRFVQYAVGSVPSPFDCYLVNRSLKTLKIRMEEHQRNALVVGKYLEAHPKVTKVSHPGLDSHPDRAVVKRQQYGHSGMISFTHEGGLEESNAFLKKLKVFTLAESLGGFESLAEIPFSMTHASMSVEDRAAAGVTNNLIRLSIGLENPEDLKDDLDEAFKAAFS